MNNNAKIAESIIFFYDRNNVNICVKKKLIN